MDGAVNVDPGGDELGDNPIPEQAATAPIRVILPTGEEVTGRLHHRWQDDNGAWFYQVSVSLWSTVHDPGGAGEHAAPYDVTFAAPAERVSPVRGARYDQIPVHRSRAALVRARTGRTAAGASTSPAAAGPAGSASASRWPPVRGDDTDRWYIQTRRLAADAPPPPPVTVHHAECFVGTGPAELTTAQAIEALAQPGAEGCAICGADQLQRSLP